MAKSKPKSPLSGRWRIVSMEQWDEEFIDEEEEGYIEFDGNGMGSFHFGYVHGNMDCQATTREGQPCYLSGHSALFCASSRYSPRALALPAFPELLLIATEAG